ncbi:two-component system, OmpR family, sensor histidine kinase KdpD [Verrucomicrobium sp. GAS474]|uniref:universal stress protein n=1 Tax=Verrucomicrobium sp. GAS474 TaxID=1882831 RepID=UPI00087C9844|nr:universal stress protein [Verrucomicrobium sp. GAS474]SDU08555.1 two-component system, OmpR family, sensor histidine kinase KdpD [Verrucomicrobium sp. GAS474]
MNVRPSPEDFLRLIERQRRGKLKVYLGSAAGVGKTYAMLVEGRRLRDLGVDAVIGYVEPHARPETTAQIGGLERVPPREVRLGGGGPALAEMDLDAVLRRKPTVALVDEMAHTNAAGSPNAKRYDDIEALLDAGIHVITTLNVQHFESLCNVVEQATGIRVRERVPDTLIAEADQIVNVDLPAEDLIDRLKAGKIYPPEQAARALEHFFTEENLTRLREMALSEAANFLDRRQRRKTDAEASAASPTLARVVVAVSSGGPHPEILLRKASRLAHQLNGTWQAVYVRTPREHPNRLSLEMERRLAATLEIAQKMGGTVIVLKGADVVAALAGFAREAGASHLVMGKPGAKPLSRLFRKSWIERLAAALPGVDILLG